ncbi:hypothetical protein [Streptomyces luteocolor]|uniref:hypothetical protein n=1 Tax=Streptomyces luteocolor TaxID=285500 RepID=UPI000B1070C4|nr:hypothetical protein [Streptomyces luteocolor]
MTRVTQEPYETHEPYEMHGLHQTHEPYAPYAPYEMSEAHEPHETTPGTRADPPRRRERQRLDAALDRLTATLHGMTAHPDEAQCDCHWGSEEELALLKVPGRELDPDLLERTWRAPDWRDHPALLRRILPQFAAHLVDGRIEALFGMAEVGHCLARGKWQEWPEGQGAAVEEFLRAWWAWTLTEPEPPVPAHDVLTVCAEASGTPSPWLGMWQQFAGPVADRHLAEAVAEWEYDLLGDALPWAAWDRAEEKRRKLAAWLVRRAPDRLRAHGAPDELLHRVRLLGLEGEPRWTDPHWPGHRY